MLKKILIISSVFVLAGVGYYLWQSLFPKGEVDQISDSKKIATIYKSPTCGCCVQYGKYMENNGYDVEMIMVGNMQEIKDKYGISRDMESCHTMVIDGKVIEGHVPIEVVEQYLSDDSVIADAIALPNMPAGSPGMPGKKREPFRVYAVTDGDADIYLDY